MVLFQQITLPTIHRHLLTKTLTKYQFIVFISSIAEFQVFNLYFILCGRESKFKKLVDEKIKDFLIEKNYK